MGKINAITYSSVTRKRRQRLGGRLGLSSGEVVRSAANEHTALNHFFTLRSPECKPETPLVNS